MNYQTLQKLGIANFDELDQIKELKQSFIEDDLSELEADTMVDLILLNATELKLLSKGLYNFNPPEDLPLRIETQTFNYAVIKADCSLTGCSTITASRIVSGEVKLSDVLLFSSDIDKIKTQNIDSVYELKTNFQSIINNLVNSMMEYNVSTFIGFNEAKRGFLLEAAIWHLKINVLTQPEKTFENRQSLLETMQEWGFAPGTMPA